MWGVKPGFSTAGLVASPAVVIAAPLLNVVWLPAFGSGTSKMKGGVPVTAPCLALGAVHTASRPDIVVMLVSWCMNPAWLTSYLGKLLEAADLNKARKHPRRWWPTTTYLEAIALKDFEPGLHVERVPDALPAPLAPGRTHDDDDAITIPGVCRKVGWYLKLDELKRGWSMRDLLDMYPPERLRLLPDSTIGSLTGLVPTEPDYEPIAADAMDLDGVTLRIGAERAKPLPMIKIAEHELGEITRPPAPGETTLRVRRAYDAEHPAVADYLAAMPRAADREYLEILGSCKQRAVILSDEIVEVALVDLPRDRRGRVVPATVVPLAMYHLFRLNHSNVYASVLRVESLELKALQQPTTPEYAVETLIECAPAEAVDLMAETIRNEIYAQVTPETTAQKSLADARVVLRGQRLAPVAALVQAAGRELRWRGDRSLTLEYYFESENELVGMLGLARAGWVVPAREPDRKGADRKRAQRHAGFMLVFMHADADGKGSNFIRYSLESQRLELGLSVGFFTDAGLQFKTGAEPPPPTAALGDRPVYDIVEREWLAEAAARHVTLARADARFAQERLL